MAVEVVEQDDLPRAQHRTQELADVGHERERIDRALQGQGRSHALRGERGNQGRNLPVIARNAPVGALPLGSTGIERSQG